jgi:ABC-type lipoprotein release transport system permease subunit
MLQIKKKKKTIYHFKDKIAHLNGALFIKKQINMKKEHKSIYREPIMQIFYLDQYKISLSKKITDKLEVQKGDWINLEVINKKLIIKKSPENVGYKITVNESKAVSFRSKSFMIAVNNYLDFLKIKGTSHIFEVDLETMKITFLRSRFR